MADCAGSPDTTNRTRTLRYLLYAFIFVSSCMQVAVVPLLPAYARRFGLTGFEQALVLAATGLATLVVALPAGAISDRFGARRVTIWAGALMATAACLEAVAPSFGLLLLARLIFGTGYGVTWTAGLSWLAEGSPGGSSLGGSVATSGIGSVLGPASFGFLVEYFGLAIPFVFAAGAFVVITAGLALTRLPTGAPAPAQPLLASLRFVALDRTMLFATASIVVAGATTGVANLLVPGELHDAGLSTGGIGAVLSLAGLIFMGGCMLTAWLGDRVVRSSIALVGMLMIAVFVTPAVASAAPFAIFAMLLATAGARSVVWTIAYPLGAVGAERSGAGVGVVMGLMNGVWAAVSVLSPLAAGIVAEHSSPQAAFGVAQVCCGILVAATVLFARSRARPRPARAQCAPGPSPQRASVAGREL